eukprot:m.60014 g.60014  ORF g.60014 m.60014 type:complete len:51 (-) comp22788_c0_seq1:40-192(-)
MLTTGIDMRLRAYAVTVKQTPLCHSVTTVRTHTQLHPHSHTQTVDTVTDS